MAATGVGAGDLATAAFTGAAVGTGILFAVPLGAALKWLLSEGLARWQLGTGETLVEGAARHLGKPFAWAFLLYLLPWTFFVSAALMSACGVAAHAILPISDAATDKVVYGILHGVVGVALVRIGGYSLFERVMAVAIAIMFGSVVITAARLAPPLGEVLAGFVPRVPPGGQASLEWTIALLGGVGGTVTLLSYGYWIREEGRDSEDELGACRLDLALGYTVTAAFGVAMVLIGSVIEVEGRGAGLIVALGDRLGDELGPVIRGLFLAGAWGAVASSLLGVWQAVPYLFADLIDLVREPARPVDTRESEAPRRPIRVVDVQAPAYRWVLYAMATLPILGLWLGFSKVQRLYAIVGALFLPMMSAVLLVLNRPNGPLGRERGNGPATTLGLGLTLAFFVTVFVLVLI